MRSLFQKVREYMPLGSMIIFALTFVSALIYALCAVSCRFADFINYETTPVRIVLSAFSSIVPFSVFEIILILSPIWVFLLVFLAIRVAKKGKKQTIKMLMCIISVVLCYFISFVFTFGSGYHTTKIEDKLGLNREGITPNELYLATEAVANELNELSIQISYDENGASVLPYSYNELSEKICDAYYNLSSKTGLFNSFNSRVKPILLSKPMTYTHISGVYISLTGEANINTNYPDYIVVSSSAHEMAHQRGIAREDESSFVGFLALISSDDPYLKYSAYLDVYSYLLSDLKNADSELYKSAKALTNSRVNGDMRAYSKQFEKYQDSLASNVTNSINNSYLQANGDKNGTESYRLVSELVCAYLLNRS